MQTVTVETTSADDTRFETVLRVYMHCPKCKHLEEYWYLSGNNGEMILDSGEKQFEVHCNKCDYETIATSRTTVAEKTEV